MTLEQLKEMLASGTITQEQFNAMAKMIDPNYKPEDNGGDSDPEDKGGDPKPDDKGTDIEDLITRAVDRATNKLGNENARLKKELDRIKKAKMTEQELQEEELREKQEELAERERQVKEYESRMYALKAIKKAGLDKGGEIAMELAEFIMTSADDEEGIDARVQTFKKLFDAAVKEEVDALFKSNGRKPDKGGKGGSSKHNPYAKETFNLTEQMKLETSDPQLAETLKREAGLK